MTRFRADPDHALTGRRVVSAVSGRTKTQRGVGNHRRVLMLLNQDADVGRHSRKQQTVRIGRRNHHGVGHDVLHHPRSLPNLEHARPGYESTPKKTRCPVRTAPISASLTNAFARMSERSRAMVKSVGACRLAASVWPSSTLRRITTPSIGDLMVLRSRSSRARSREARAAITPAVRTCSRALAADKSAASARAVICARSASRWETLPFLLSAALI